MTRLAILDILMPGWTAGGTYTRMAARSVGDLAKHSPGLDVLRVTRDRRSLPGVTIVPLADRPASLPGEEAWRRRRGWESRTTPLPGERRLRQALRLRNPADPLWVAEEAEADAAFPVVTTPRSGSQMGLVGWIPDLQHINFPDFFSSAERAARDGVFRSLAERCHRMVLSSQTVADEFAREYPGFVDKTHVLRFPSRYVFDAPDTSTDVRGLYHLPDRYFLCVNQFWRHKNHLLVVRALAEAVKKDPEITVVFTGLLADSRDPDNSYLSELVQLVAEAGVHRNVRILGLVPLAHLDALFAGADALVQPSVSEGWSTSVADAQALGTPVIALDTAVLREQVTHGALCADDPRSLSSVLLDPPVRTADLDAARAAASGTATAYAEGLRTVCEEARDAARR